MSSPASTTALDRTGSQSPMQNQSHEFGTGSSTAEKIPVKGVNTTSVLGVREADTLQVSHGGDLKMDTLPQLRSETPDGTSYNMEGVQSSLPQSVWPYGFSDNPDGDTLASMEYFAGDQFWDTGLVSDSSKYPRTKIPIGFQGSWLYLGWFRSCTCYRHNGSGAAAPRTNGCLPHRVHGGLPIRLDACLQRSLGHHTLSTEKKTRLGYKFPLQYPPSCFLAFAAFRPLPKKTEPDSDSRSMYLDLSRSWVEYYPSYVGVYV